MKRWIALASLDLRFSVYANIDDSYDLGRKEAIDALTKLAQAGDPLSANALAERVSDSAVALKWHEIAANGGVTESALYCARAYQQGYGTEGDVAKAKEWFKVVEQAGPEFAAVVAAERRHVPKDNPWQKRAAELAQAALDSLNKHADFNEFFKANPQAATVAQRGDDAGLQALCYLVGHGVTLDVARAHGLLGKTSGPLQSYLTGWIHEQALVGERPFGTGAVFCYESIKDQPAAAYRLGVIYRAGELTAQDDTKATAYFLKAAEGGCIPAMLEAAKALHNGTGIDADNEQAKAWAKKAADAGSEAAVKLLKEWE